VRRWLGRTYLRLAGWRIEGAIPSEPKFVVVAAPHTSYWDFPYMIAFSFATRQHSSFLMKASLFVGPLGSFLRRLGGIPVDRAVAGGLVESVAREFEGRDELILVIAPEGTRARGEYWKSGFYHVARRAGVPIALSFLDYGNKTVGYGPLFWPSGDGDEELLVSFYADKRGRYPDQATPPRLRDLSE
jgi:1-acyl-sn-glycerol-3-phosphate acyltransferase